MQNTVKLTDAQARFLREGGKLHHMTAKALHRLGLVDAHGKLTEAGSIAKDELRGNDATEVTFPTRKDVAPLTDAERATMLAAIRLVGDDERRSYPEVTNSEAVEHVWNSVTLPGQGCQGGSELEMDDHPPTARAFHLVLSYPKAVRWFLDTHEELVNAA